MTTDPLDDRAAPQALPPMPRDSTVARVVSWLVIAASVISVGTYNWHASRKAAHVESVEEVQLEIVSRAAVGWHSLATKVATAASPTAEPVFTAVRQAALTPAQRLKAVCVVGEVAGAEAALEDLDKLKASLTDPKLRADAQTLRQVYLSGPESIPADKRQELVRDQGWFGELALTYKLADDQPLRHSIIHRARVAFFALLGVEGAIAVALLAGIVLLILAIVFLALGRLPLAYRPAGHPTSAYIESFAIYLGGFILLSLAVRFFMRQPGFLASAIAIAWVPFPMLWPLLRGVRWRELRRGLGWHSGRGALWEMGAGVLGYLAGLPIVAVCMLLSVWLARAARAHPSHPIMFSARGGVAVIVELYLLACLWAPVIEETMFRGALFHHLRQKHTWLLSAVLSSFIFAAIHPQGWTMIPILGSIGFVFAAIREWRGTALASAAAHALNNGVMITVLILTLR